ncbi:MAG: hypothetical protein Q4Q24_08110 [Methanobrevibacter ruminantium]|uniref:hypothetical protein n=1 Tax=Methanobrevibacter ruminantium TaxID=83816 RepID=UPI0026EDBDF5|nr:hypothetical protein [Methanobrevibacter ruminantium]MDO5843214.1 hypothetical protein [Methanobrevibacter ruminantium]
MNDAGKILIGVLIGLIFVGLAITFAPHDAYTNSTDNATLADQVQSNDNLGSLSIVKNSTSNSSAVKSNSTGSQLSSSSSGSGVSGGSTEYNGQAGGGYYYQINYKDGNFRQYDTKTGELIGSSFDEDQEKLGNFNGEML